MSPKNDEQNMSKKTNESEKNQKKQTTPKKEEPLKVPRGFAEYYEARTNSNDSGVDKTQQSMPRKEDKTKQQKNLDAEAKEEIKNQHKPKPTTTETKEQSKVPPGFANFFEGNKDNSNEKENEKNKNKDEPRSKTREEEKFRGFADFFGGNKDKNKDDPRSKKREKDNADGDRGNWFPGISGLNTEDPKNNYMYMIVAIVGGLCLYYWLKPDDLDSVEQITFQEFKDQYLQAGSVDHIVVRGDVDETTKMVYVHTKQSADEPIASFRVGCVNTFERQLEEAQIMLEVDPRDYVPVKYDRETTRDSNTNFVLSGLQLCLFGALAYMMWSRMGGSGGKGGRGIFSIGKSNATIIKPGDKTSVSFADVAGLDNAKREVMEFVKFLKTPENFTRLGAKLPKGALLVGPPGTGKTLLAKATAGEASVPFFSISGSDFIEMFVGVGPSRVRDLFAEARKHAPAIIFIDEIDAVGRARGSGKFGGGNDERENTLNQLLVEMDGFEDTEQLVVMAGTNRADILDPALLRPGRFDRQIQIEKPDLKGRMQILKVHLQPLTLSLDVKEVAHRLGCLTPGFTGADLANVCNEAAIVAARGDKDKVDLDDFEAAVDRVLAGIESNTVLSKEERKLVAYHEAGHAVVGWFLEYADPLLKVTIVPRGKGALGFAQYLPNEVMLRHKQQLVDSMCTALGGRAAEQVFFGRVSTGAANDLQQVSRLARAQIASFGMSDRLGNVNYETDPNQFQKPFSERTAQIIDEEVEAAIAVCYKRTLDLVNDHKDKVKALGEKLLEKETVNHDVIVEVLGPRPFTSENYLQVISHMASAKDKIKNKSTENSKGNQQKGENKKEDNKQETEDITVNSPK